MTNLEPGWLLRTMHDAHISVMCNHHPKAVNHIHEIQLPIPEVEARELYERMDERFKAWTGKSLAVWQGEPRD